MNSGQPPPPPQTDSGELFCQILRLFNWKLSEQANFWTWIWRPTLQLKIKATLQLKIKVNSGMNSGQLPWKIQVNPSAEF